jgi:hypothetical protein
MITARPDITQPQNMLDIQGDRVIVYKHGPTGERVMAWVLTLVRVIDMGCQSMRMVNRENKTRQPDWLFTQKWYDRLLPAGENKLGAKWQVTVK